MSLSPRTIALCDPQPADPVINCPHCQHEIKLTESLAAPLLKARELEFKQREAALRDREAAFENALTERLTIERKKLADEEHKKARLALGNELETKQRELNELNEVLKEREAKLATAQALQAELVRKQRELDDQKRELDLTIEKRISEQATELRAKAKQQAESELSLKISEKDLVIRQMQQQLEDMKRKAEQGSQQLQGEVQELELEHLLTSRFARDAILPVPKGEFGGDILQHVMGPANTQCGTILWESKRTKNWSDGWLAKLRQDQRVAKADFAVLVTRALPKNVEHFDLIDNVYVISPSCVVPIAMMLRQALIDLSMARQSVEGRGTKMEMVYQYLTGPQFRQRIQAIVEAFSAMQEDLNQEKKAFARQWAKREVQIERVIGSTAGLYGDLQGIAGKVIQEVEGLSIAGMLDATPKPDLIGTTAQ